MVVVVVVDFPLPEPVPDFGTVVPAMTASVVVVVVAVGGIVVVVVVAGVASSAVSGEESIAYCWEHSAGDVTEWV